MVRPCAKFTTLKLTKRENGGDDGEEQCNSGVSEGCSQMTGRGGKGDNLILMSDLCESDQVVFSSSSSVVFCI